MKKVTVFILSLLLLVSFTGCTFIETIIDDGSADGCVNVVSGGITFEAAEYQTSAYSKNGKSFITDIDFNSVINELSVKVPYNDDLTLELSGVRYGDVTYTVYDENGDFLRDSTENLELPTSSGSWIIQISVTWGDENKNKSFDYFFKLIRKEE